jgi:DNA-binding beta-propeller fold protein YncE
MNLANRQMRRHTLRLSAGGAVALALAAGCGGGGGGSSEPPPPPESGVAFVVTTDFQSGSFTTLPLDDPEALEVNRGSIGSDAVARFHDGRVYVINRFGADNVQALDPEDDFATIYQCSVGNGANPQDIAFASSSKAYVTRFETTTVAIVDPSVGADCRGFVQSEIDLRFLADDDGVPELWQMAIVGDRLYVAAQRLDRNNFFEPTDASYLAVIDVDTDTVVDVDPSTPELDGIRLTGTNPFGETKGLAVDGTDILVAEAGSFGALDGGIERVDTRTNRAEGFFVTEADLGGSITDFVLVDGRRAYAVLSDADFNNRLVRFDPATGAVASTLASGAFFIPDIERDAARDRIYAASQDLTSPGILVFDGASDAPLTAAPLDTGLPPFNLVIAE